MTTQLCKDCLGTGDYDLYDHCEACGGTGHNLQWCQCEECKADRAFHSLWKEIEAKHQEARGR